MKLQDLTLKQFIEKVAANEAVPGGGSCAAQSAAIGTALIEMMANLTIGKKKYIDVEDRMKEIVAVMSENRVHFINDIDRDADSYRLVMNAYRLPKETDQEIALRKDKIEEATKTASLVPMEVAERAYNLFDTMIETMHKGNSNTVTDGLVGVMTCRTAIMGALQNVKINLSGIKDKEFVAKLSEKCNHIEKSVLEKEMEAINWVKTQY